MDDFERKLAVALKTAADDLPAAVETAGATEAIEIPTRPAQFRRRPRLALAAVVVAVLVLAVGGSWWALSDRVDDRTAPAGEHACTAADTTVGLILGADGSNYVAGFAVRATTACTLGIAPTAFADGAAIAWDATPTDTSDPNVWAPLALTPDTRVVFVVEATPVAGNTTCRGGVDHVELRFGLEADDLTPTVGVTVGMCGPLTFTTGSVETVTSTPTSGTSDACTASDLTVTPRDIGQGVGAVGIDVVARTACTLDAPPSVTVAGTAVPYAASLNDGAHATPWTPTSLEVGDDLPFEVTFGDTSSASCLSGSVPLGVSVAVDSDAPTAFTWTASNCGVELLRVTPRSVSPDAAGACTVDDLEAQPVAASGSASVRISTRDGATCTLVDPPTVLVDGGLVSWRASTDPQVGGAWATRQLSPDNDVTLVLTHVCGASSCPAGARDEQVTVSVAATSIATFTWPYRGGLGFLVSTVQ